MKAALGLLLLVGLAAGCGAPTVAIPRAQFALIYADTKATVSVWIDRSTRACVEQKLSPETCSDIKNTLISLRLLDEQARAVILQADREVDWSQFLKYLELAIGLAAKAAL